MKCGVKGEVQPRTRKPLDFSFINLIAAIIWAALPFKLAAEQQNICSRTIVDIQGSCRAAKYYKNNFPDILPNNNDLFSSVPTAKDRAVCHWRPQAETRCIASLLKTPPAG